MNSRSPPAAQPNKLGGEHFTITEKRAIPQLEIGKLASLFMEAQRKLAA
jgi:hypothetical protein